MENNFFEGKKILITGINGFIGSHLATKFIAEKAKVYGISRSGRRKNTLRANVNQFSAIHEFIQKKKIDICFHLAGEALVEEGQKDPYRTFKTNIEGTLTILESCRRNNLTRVIIASTSHVYGANKLPYVESYTPKPTRPYETSKACIDLIAQSYAETYNLPVLVPRFVNVYGPGDKNFNRLIPHVIQSILLHKPLHIWGGDAVRDYLYIDDAINALLKLARVDISEVGQNRVFNFGSNNIIAVKDLVNKIIDLSKSKINITNKEQNRLDEIKSQYVSWRKAKRILKWQPEVDLDEGLSMTLKWYKNNII